MMNLISNIWYANLTSVLIDYDMFELKYDESNRQFFLVTSIFNA
jgi:hypothetical protein